MNRLCHTEVKVNDEENVCTYVYILSIKIEIITIVYKLLFNVAISQN